MGFTVPDKGEGASNIQSILFQEDIDILVDGISGLNCVLSGGNVSVTGSPTEMSVSVEKAAILSNGVLYACAATVVAIGAADSTNPRIDIVVATSAGISVRAGTAAAAPSPPVRTANDVALAFVYVAPSVASIGASAISDKRVIRTQGPICIYKTTAAETTNTTAAAIEALNKANSGVTIPSGLFLAGRTLRVRLGGNMLLNSGTPTVRVVIAYGGTTMFSDISAASTADADRVAWALDFDIVAQGNSDQSLNGTLAMGIIAAKTAPTTGIGDAWSTANNVNAVSGAAAVDSGAADRLLSVQITFSVSNASNELVVESASVELV